MIVFCLLILLVAWFVLRGVAGYDSRIERGGYVRINHRFFRALLIRKWSPMDRADRPKQDLDKISCVGICFYVLGALVLVASLVLCCVIEPIPLTPREWETELGIEMANDKAALLLCAVFMFLCFAWEFYKLFFFAKREKTNAERIGCRCICGAAMALMGGMIVILIIELVCCFL